MSKQRSYPAVFASAVLAVAMLISACPARSHDALGASDWIGEGSDKYVSPGGKTRCCGRNDCAKVDSDAVSMGLTVSRFTVAQRTLSMSARKLGSASALMKQCPMQSYFRRRTSHFGVANGPGPRNRGPPPLRIVPAFSLLRLAHRSEFRLARRHWVGPYATFGDVA